MIQIDVLVMGKPERTMRFEDKNKAAAKREFLKYWDRYSCYALVTVDGKALKLAEALRFFRLPPVFKHVPRELAMESSGHIYRRK